MYYEVQDVIKYMQKTLHLLILLMVGVQPAVLCDKGVSLSTPALMNFEQVSFCLFNGTEKEKGRY